MRRKKLFFCFVLFFFFFVFAGTDILDFKKESTDNQRPRPGQTLRNFRGVRPAFTFINPSAYPEQDPKLYASFLP